MESTMNMLERAVIEQKERAKQAKGELNTCRERIYNAVREIKKLHELRLPSEDELDERSEAAIERIMSHPLVENIEYNDGKLIVHTGLCVAEDDRTGIMHKIGHFKIQIKLDGRAGDIRWHNKDGQTNGYEGGMQAPHVFSDGHACLGTGQEILNSSLDSGELDLVVDMAIQFVCNANTSDSAGSRVDEWPVYEEEEEKAKTKEKK